MGRAVVALGRAIAFEWSWRAEAGNSTELRLRGIILDSVNLFALADTGMDAPAIAHPAQYNQQRMLDNGSSDR